VLIEYTAHKTLSRPQMLYLEGNTDRRPRSAVDVNIYGSVGTDSLRGNHENTEIGEFLREYLDVDVQAITDELAEKSKTFGIATTTDQSWTGREPTEQDLYTVERHYEHLYGETP
jgi:alkaline phosphatase